MKFTDAKLKNLLGFILKNKIDLMALMDYFQYSDIEAGKLIIPDYMINVGIKDKILRLDNVGSYIKDYTVLFKGQCIILDLRLNLKQMGPVSAKYIISIKEFKFDENCARIYATFNEEMTSLGNVMQSIALKTLIASSSGLQKVVQFANCDFIFVDGHNLMIDLGKFEVVRKTSEFLELNYLGCEDGQMSFTFYYCG